MKNISRRDFLKEALLGMCGVATISTLVTQESKPTKEQLEKRYIEEGKTSYQITEELGISDKTVYKWLRGYNIPTRKVFF